MNDEEILDEYIKCKCNPYYFATHYIKVYDQDADEYLFTTTMSEEEFNEYFRMLENGIFGNY